MPKIDLAMLGTAGEGSQIDAGGLLSPPLCPPAHEIPDSPLLNVLDDFNREGLGIEVDFSLPAERVVRVLNQIIEWCGKPGVIRVDNGPEYTSGTLMTWAQLDRVAIQWPRWQRPGRLWPALRRYRGNPPVFNRVGR